MSRACRSGDVRRTYDILGHLPRPLQKIISRLLKCLRGRSVYRSTGYLYSSPPLPYAPPMPDRSPASLESLLSSAPVWRGRQLACGRARSTGFEILDQHLPGGGWPVGALTEILPACAGLGEVSLILPVLRALSQEGRAVVLISPPVHSLPPALRRAGLELHKVLWIEAQRDDETRWAAEQLLRQGATVLLWSQSPDDRSLRRLQLAAQTGSALAFAFRPQQMLANPSPAALRLALHPHETGVRVQLVKVRGGHAAQFTVPLGPAA